MFHASGMSNVMYKFGWALSLEREATLRLVTSVINLCSWGLHRIKDIGEGREGENFAFIPLEEGVGKCGEVGEKPWGDRLTPR